MIGILRIFPCPLRVLMTALLLGPGISNALRAQVPCAASEVIEVVEWVDEAWLASQQTSSVESDEETDVASGSVAMDSAGVDPLANEQDKSSRVQRVFGQDERTHVTNVTAFPYRTMGRLTLYWKDVNQSYMGSGVLIGPKTVLTCAHAITGQKRWCSEVTFTPGQNGNTKPYGTFKVVKMQVPLKYYEEENRNYDLGLLILDKAVGKTTGYMYITSKTASYFESGTLNTAGYPGDLGDTKLYKSSGSALGTSGNLVQYQIDTGKGMSGGPVWIYTPSDGKRWVVAINVAENSEYNFGVYLTSGLFNLVNNYLKANDTIYYPTDTSGEDSGGSTGTGTSSGGSKTCGSGAPLLPTLTLMATFATVRSRRRSRRSSQ